MISVLVFLLFLFSAADPDGGQLPIRDPAGLLAEYAKVVESYRRGGIERVEADLQNWDHSRVREVIALLARLRNSDPVLLDTRIARPDVGGWSMRLIGAAALLHADAFLQHAKRGSREPGHLNLATEWLSLYTGAAAEPLFRLDATLSILWMRQISGQLTDVKRLVAIARKEFSHSPEIAMSEGCLEEAAASPRTARQPFIREALRRAAKHYQRALSQDPRLSEARLRLGYVQFRLGHADEGSRELERAWREAHDARTAYLARLFIGATHEHAGRYDEAIAAYREARAVGPQCQIAAIALAHALHRAGDRAAAAAAAREASGLDETSCEDPWWSYDYGQGWKLEDTMEALRAEVRR